MKLTTKAKKPAAIAYRDPLFAVCGVDPKTGTTKIIDQRGPTTREAAQYYADCWNAWYRVHKTRAVLCPIGPMYIDTSKIGKGGRDGAL